MTKDILDKLLKTIRFVRTESQDTFDRSLEDLFVEFNSSKTIRIDHVNIFGIAGEALIYEPEDFAVDYDHLYPVSIAYDKASKVWQVSTVGFTFRGVIISSCDEDVPIQEISIANDKISDSSKNFQNMRLPPPMPHFSECGTQVNSLSAGECSAYDKRPLPSVDISQSGEEKWRSQPKRKRKAQRISFKNVCMPWQMLRPGLSERSRESSQTSQTFLMSTQRQFRILYRSYSRFWKPFLRGSGMKLLGIFLSSSFSLDASTLCGIETSSFSSFAGGISN